MLKVKFYPISLQEFKGVITPKIFFYLLNNVFILIIFLTLL